MKDLANLPLGVLLAAIAITGGIARYMSNYEKGTPFRVGMLLAGMFSSGFAGVIFGFIGLSMDLPIYVVFVMTGTGGYFADQAMKFALEFVDARSK